MKQTEKVKPKRDDWRLDTKPGEYRRVSLVSVEPPKGYTSQAQRYRELLIAERQNGGRNER